jgi:hypothetical protein
VTSPSRKANERLIKYGPVLRAPVAQLANGRTKLADQPKYGYHMHVHQGHIILSSEHPFPQHSRQHVKGAPRAGSFGAIRAAASALQSGLIELELALADLELDGDLLSLQRQPLIPEAAPQVDEVVIERVEQIQCACEDLLRRPLRGAERTIVLGWATLTRDGDLVPVAEIIDLTSRLLSKPTPEGTLPSGLRWCETTVQTLARAPVALLRARNAMNQASEFASLYEELADRLEGAGNDAH